MPKVKAKDDFPTHFEANKEVVENSKVGDTVTLKVKGKVSSVEQRERNVFPDEPGNDTDKAKKKTVYELGVNVDTIEFEYPNEFSKMSEE